METNKFLEIRFLVPPMVVVIFGFWAHPAGGLHLISRLGPAGIIFSGAAFLLSLGWIIGSIGSLFIELATADPCCDSKFPSRATLKPDTIKEIKKKKRNALIFLFGDGDKGEILTQPAKEVATWIAVARKEDEYLKDQLHKRWNAFHANFNSFIGLLLVLIFEIYQFCASGGQWNIPSGAWWLAWLFAGAVFLTSSYLIYESVKEIDNVFVRRYLE